MSGCRVAIRRVDAPLRHAKEGHPMTVLLRRGRRRARRIVLFPPILVWGAQNLLGA